MTKIMKSYRLNEEVIEIMLNAVDEINKNLGTKAVDNTKLIEMLVIGYTDNLIERLNCPLSYVN